MNRSSLALVLLCATATAQATHTQLFPATSPAGRAGVHGVSDGGGMLVFGGLLVGGTIPTFSDEIWRFDGTNWTDLSPAVRPPARDWYASAYDPARSRYVLFGGRIVGGTTTIDAGDTWEFDGTSWLQLTPANTPSARRWSAMVYDPTSSRCILFGGSTLGSAYLGDTWAWDGSNWTQLSPATSPSPRARGWLEWDILHNRALYVGGRDAAPLAETWQWDGADWSQIVTATAPGWNNGNGLFAYGMTHDLLRDRFVVVGGTRTSGVSNQTWEFDGTDWLLHNSAQLPGRTAPAVAYVLGLGKTIVFGGYGGTAALNDTYDYQTSAWPAFTPFGAGCSGPAGVPTLTETHPSWLGETASGSVGSLATNGICALAIGLSNTTWTGGALPFPLLFVYPQTQSGCQLLTSPDSTLLLLNQGGNAAFSLNLPPSAAYAGVDFHLQAAQLDAAFQLSVSGGATWTLGAK